MAGKRGAVDRKPLAGQSQRPRPKSQAPLGGAAVLKFSDRALCPSIKALIEEWTNDLLEATTATPLAKRMRRFAFAVIATTVLGLDEANRDALFEDFEIWTRALFSIPVALTALPSPKRLQRGSGC